VELPHDRFERRRHWRHILADEHESGCHAGGDTRQELGRGAVIDRHDDDAAEQAAPERDDPFRAVLAPEHDLVALADAGVTNRDANPRAARPTSTYEWLRALKPSSYTRNGPFALARSSK
jgi:hypothetical protein